MNAFSIFHVAQLMPIAQILMVDLLALVWKVTLVMEQYVKVSEVKEKQNIAENQFSKLRKYLFCFARVELFFNAFFQISTNVQPISTHVMIMLSVETLLVVLSVIVRKDGLEMVLCVKASSIQIHHWLHHQ